jgi:hypothetical protein
MFRGSRIHSECLSVRSIIRKTGGGTGKQQYELSLQNSNKLNPLTPNDL